MYSAVVIRQFKSEVFLTFLVEEDRLSAEIGTTVITQTKNIRHV